jgi:arylsulfatase A-like enzyme
VSERPNILFITTDQQRWDCLSLYDTPGLHTPELDRLASEGLCFENAYCSSPLCIPSRVSMMSGQYPSRHGAHHLRSRIDFDFPTLPGILTTQGYHTAIIGKTHFVPREVEAAHVAGVERPDPLSQPDREYGDQAFWRSFDGPYLGFDHVRQMFGHSSERKPSEHYRVWLEDQGWDLAEMDSLHGKGGSSLWPAEGRSAGLWPLPEDAHQNAWMNDEAERNIRKQHGSGKPWFCWVSYQDPHSPYVCPDPYYSDVDMTGVDLGSIADGEYDGKPAWYKGLHETGAYDDGKPKPRERFGPATAHHHKRVAKPKEAIQAYIGMCNMLDAYIGRLLNTLRSMGALENTIVVFTSDHGDYLGQHGFWSKGLPAYDDAQKVPLIVWWPPGMNGVQKGRTQALFSLVDLPATFLDIAELDQVAGMQGISQMPVICGETRAVRDWVLVENLPTSYMQQMTFVKDGHKLVINEAPESTELYDLHADPRQMRNLANNPEFYTLKEDLQSACDVAIKEKDRR